ncbi:MAG: hypothetical protein LBU65_09085 [Planctomycetaceae bacterium]|jgi:hypothetical protein|nr:hypothetical protein [Planctomycetaceae bacterium]
MSHVPKYRHHKSRNRGFSEHNGKWVYFPGAYNSPESKRAYAAFLHSIAAPSDEPVTLIKGQDVTIEFLCTAFLEYALFHYQKHGRTTGRKQLGIEASQTWPGHANLSTTEHF